VHREHRHPHFRPCVALASGFALPAPGISAANPPGLAEGLWAIPGAVAALGLSYWYGARSER
jgi:hypothetical protein